MAIEDVANVVPDVVTICKDDWTTRDDAVAFALAGLSDPGAPSGWQEAGWPRKLLAQFFDLPLELFRTGAILLPNTEAVIAALQEVPHPSLLGIALAMLRQGTTIQLVKQVPARWPPPKVPRLNDLLRLWRYRNSAGNADYDHRGYNSWIPIQRYWKRQCHRTILTWYYSLAEYHVHPVLDIACGSSRIFQDVPNAIGMDIDIKKCRFSVSQTGRPVVQADIGRIPFRPNSFGLVICSEVIEHVSPEQFDLAQMRALLRPGGYLIVATPDYSRPVWHMLEAGYGILLPNGYARDHVTHYTRKSLIGLLMAHGFRIVKTRYVGGCDLFVLAQRE